MTAVQLNTPTHNLRRVRFARVHYLPCTTDIDESAFTKMRIGQFLSAPLLPQLLNMIMNPLSRLLIATDA